MENIVGIVVGFALTTLAGGWWAARLQERSWVRQNDVRLREAENERAGAACQDLTLLFDRRLYRMQRLLWAADGSADAGEIGRRREEYVDVLFAWNDHLNTNLSVVGSYFGDEARAYLDGLYEDFKRVGQGVETVVRAARAGEETTGISKHVALEFEGREAGSLNDRVYQPVRFDAYGPAARRTGRSLRPEQVHPKVDELTELAPPRSALDELSALAPRER